MNQNVFLGITVAVRHGRHMIQNNTRPSGRVKQNSDSFMYQQACAQLVKFVCRHISKTIPPGKVRQKPSQNRAAIQAELNGMDLELVPEPYSHWICVLLADEVIPLPTYIYEAAFTTELLGPMSLVNQAQSITFLLLAGAGYDVYHATIPSQDDY
jgi:hypothetical protein